MNQDNIPAKIGKYDIVDVLGKGSMGLVYKGHDAYVDRAVAIKVATNTDAEDDGESMAKRMFVNEHYLTLIMRPAVGSADRTGLLLKRIAKGLRSRRLVIAARPEDEAARVCFEVTDHGPGIPPEVAARVVEYLDGVPETSRDGDLRVYGPYADRDGRDLAWLVKIGEDGRLKLYRWQYGYDQLISVSVASAPARGWHYIELQVTQGTSNGILSVRINGILAIQMTAQNTIQGGGQLLTAFVGAVPGQNCPLTIDVDDFYIADTSGTINNTFLGDVRVDALQAQADGSLNQWTASPVGTAAWEAVSDEDEATAISAPNVGLRQSFDVEPLPVMATPAIYGVQLTMLARKTDAGLGKVKGLVVSGAQSAVSTDIILQEQLAWQSTLFERNPNGNVQWTEAAFNAAEFGVESA